MDRVSLEQMAIARHDWNEPKVVNPDDKVVNPDDKVDNEPKLVPIPCDLWCKFSGLVEWVNRLWR